MSGRLVWAQGSSLWLLGCWTRRLRTGLAVKVAAPLASLVALSFVSQRGSLVAPSPSAYLGKLDESPRQVWGISEAVPPSIPFCREPGLSASTWTLSALEGAVRPPQSHQGSRGGQDCHLPQLPVEAFSAPPQRASWQHPPPPAPRRQMDSPPSHQDPLRTLSSFSSMDR